MKSINYFVAMTAALAIGFTSCSKDSDPTPASDVAKTYEGESIQVKNDGVDIPEGVVTIEAVNNTQAKVTLINIVNGHAKYEATVPIMGQDGAHTFTINTTEPGMKIAVNGIIVNGKAQVVANMEITPAEITKSWMFGVDEYGNPSPVAFKLSNKSGKVMYIAGEIPVAEFSGYIADLFAVVAQMAVKDFQLTFHKNGYVGVKGFCSLLPADQQNFDLPKLARYYYNPTSGALIFDAPLAGLLPTGKATPALPAVMQVPFTCTFKDGNLTAILDPALTKTLVQLLPNGDALKALLDEVEKLVPAEFLLYFQIFKPVIVDMVNALQDKDVTEIVFGGNLQLYEAPKK